MQSWRIQKEPGICKCLETIDPHPLLIFGNKKKMNNANIENTCRPLPLSLLEN